MDKPPSASVALQTAMDMEQIGRDFYAALATVSDDAAVRDLCRRLAQAEGTHFETFRRMHGELVRAGKSTLADPRQTEQLYQGLHGLVLPDKTRVREVALGGNRSQALDMAVKMEQDSVSFYQRLAAFMPEAESAVVARIIREEQSHVCDLMGLKG